MPGCDEASVERLDHEIVDLDGRALLEEIDADQQPHFTTAFQHRSFEAGERALSHANTLAGADATLHGHRHAGGYELVNLTQVEHELVGVIDGQNPRRAIGRHCPDSFVLAAEQEDISAEQRRERASFSTAIDRRLFYQRQIERNLQLEKLPGERFFLPGLGVNRQPTAIERFGRRPVEQRAWKQIRFFLEYWHLVLRDEAGDIRLG
jgi:hypothetical protein